MGRRVRPLSREDDRSGERQNSLGRQQQHHEVSIRIPDCLQTPASNSRVRTAVPALRNRTNWVKHMEQNQRVTVRVRDTIYPARAVRVMSDEELSEFAAVWANLSVFQRDPMSFEEVWLYRLEER